MSPIKRAHPFAVFSRIFGHNIQRAREVVAAGLIRCGIGPNTLTVMGFVSTLIGAVFLAWGAGDRVGSSAQPGHSWWGFWGAWMVILASAFDILDGAVARKTNAITRMGGFLDSCVDRLSDAAVFIGIATYYLLHPERPGHQVFAIAAMVALGHAEIISYVKARAENFIESCPVGYWQRGERLAGVLIGLFSGHTATIMVMLAILPGFTVGKRLIFAARQIRRHETGRPLLDPSAPRTGWRRLSLWSYPRMTVPYDIATAINIALILFIDAQGIANHITTGA